jgi:hypothetical protein
MYNIVVHFQFPVDASMKRIWQPNMMANSSDPVFQAAMKRYFDMADDDKNGMFLKFFTRFRFGKLRAHPPPPPPMCSCIGCIFTPRTPRVTLPSGLISQEEFLCFLGRYFLLLWWRLHKGGNASIGAGASIFASLNFAAFGGAGGGAGGGVGAVANPQSALGVTEGDIVAELVELVVTALDKGETQMMNELHGDERTVRLSDGTPVTMNMPCTLTSGKGGSFRMYAEVQVVEIDPSGNYLVIQLRSGETMKLQSNPQPFQFRDLQASVNFDMLLGLSGGAKRASDHSELEYSRTDPTAGDGCLNSSEMLNLFKVLVTEACDPSYRSQLLREFSSKPEYAVFPAPAGANVQHENIYLARCLAHQLVTEDMNEFLRADKVSCVSIGNVCGRYWCIDFGVYIAASFVSSLHH